MLEIYTTGLFSFAIVFIAGFITVYSALFLKKTEQHQERRPWEFLFIASMLFFAFEFVSLLIYLGVIQEGLFDSSLWRKVFEFLYSGFVLLAIISQHDLIMNNQLILISKKDEPKDKAKK